MLRWHSRDIPLKKSWNPWATLQKAFHKFNVDEKAIIEAITKINNEQRQKVADVYKGCYGEDVDDRIDKIRGEDFRHGVKALMRRPSEYAAHELRKAMKGPGTDEEVLIEILCTKTNASIEAIKADYEKVGNHNFFENWGGFQIFKRNLEKDIKSETRGDFEKLLVALLQGQRDELEKPDKAAAKASAEELYKAGAKACFKRTVQTAFLSYIIYAPSSMVHIICVKQ